MRSSTLILLLYQVLVFMRNIKFVMLCYSMINDPTIHNPTMYDSCINYLNIHYIEKLVRLEICTLRNKRSGCCSMRTLISPRHHMKFSSVFFWLIRIYIHTYWNTILPCPTTIPLKFKLNWKFSLKKNSPGGVLEKIFSQKCIKIYRETPVTRF